MKQIYFVVLCLLANLSMAQTELITCKGYIPSQATVVDSAMDLTQAPGTNFWVCSGGDLTLRSSGGSFIFVESGGKVYIDQYCGGSIIYLKKGAILEAYNGLSNIIYFEPGAVFNTVQNAYPCPLMVYDYRRAPANGCNVSLRESAGHTIESPLSKGETDAVRVLTAEHGVSLEFYNPLNETFHLKLFDLQGKIIRSMNVNSAQVQIEKGNFKPGLYLFHLQNASGTQHLGRFVIE